MGRYLTLSMPLLGEDDYRAASSKIQPLFQNMGLIIT